MATTFGARPEDTVADSRGNVLSGVVLSLYPTQTDATNQTSLIATVSTNSKGLWPYSDASSRSLLWVRDPNGAVWPTGSQEALAAVSTKADQTYVDNALTNLSSGATSLPYIPAASLALPNPAYIAHRGGAGIAPEETMDAFRVSAAGGADGLEMDLQPLADGALGLMHDTTVDRTTNGTGNVSSYTAPAWQALNAAAKFPWNGKVVAPALLQQVLGEFGGQTPLFIEPKDQANATQLMDACDKKGAKSNVVLEISDPAILPVVKARGYKVYYWWGSEAAATTAAINTAVSGGADFLGCDGLAFSDAKITELVSKGLPVLPYTVNRRIDKARLLGLGVKGFLTDQPVYLKQTTAQRTVDSWQQGVFGHGLSFSTGAIGAITTGGLELSAASVQYAVIGEVCPLANAAATYHIDLDLGFATLPADTTRAAVLNFALSDDGNMSYNVGTAYNNGYAIWLRANGTLALFKMTSGTGSTALGSAVTTTALSAGTLAHLRVDVTPTTVTVTRTDSGGFTPITVSDTSRRGEYLGVGKSSNDGVARFKNLAIT